MKILTSIIGIAFLLYFLGGMIRNRKETPTEESRKGIPPTSSSRHFPSHSPTADGRDPTQLSERELKATGLIRLDSYLPISFNAPYLDLTDAEILERIETGINYIESSPYPGPMASHRRPNLEVTSIGQASKLLFLQTPIPREWFPQWGYEVEDYYIFSGSAEHPVKDAFKLGFAIQKNNGRSWRYSDKPIPVGLQRIEKGPRSDDYPPTE